MIAHQLNLRHAIAPASAFLSTLPSSSLALVQEPYCAKPFKKVSFVPPSHTAFSSPSLRPRAAIIVPNELGPSCFPLHSFSDRDCMAVLISRPSSPPFILCSYYMDITFNTPVISQSFSSLVSHCNINNIPLITGMDSNSHHVAWYNHYTDARGKTLQEFCHSNTLQWANNSPSPTFISHSGSSHIDLTLLNNAAITANLTNGWNITPSLSDHCKLNFNISMGPNPPSTTLSYAKCDWNTCRAAITHGLNTCHFPPLPTPAQLDSKSAFIMEEITKCHKAACPTTRLRKPKVTPWWTKECSILKATVVGRKRCAIRTHSSNAWTLYKDGKKAFRKLIKASKRKGWQAYCSKIKSTPVASRLRKTLAARAADRLGSLKNPDGSFTTTPAETLSTLASALFPSAPPSLLEPLSGTTLDPSAILTPERIEKALALITSGKASGPDEIRPELIKECWPQISHAILYIFHHSIRLGHIPEPWASSLGCIIPKPGKTDYSSPKAFRIISLSSHLLKLLERLVLWHLQLDLAIPAALKDTQFGFTRGSSTSAAIHRLASKIEEALSAGNYALGVFLDIEGAFDRISFKSIQDALINAGVGCTITNWITALISSRQTILSLAASSLSIKALSGCPQGGVLSPFLWNLVLDSLLSRFPTWPDPITAFADDLSLVVIGLDISTLVDIAQLHISTCSSWCSTKNLSISAVKTQIVLFHRKNKLTLPRPLRLNNTPIPYSKTAKYLGVTLDSRLSWLPHIKAASQKATSTLFACRKAVSSQWGLSPAISKFIYTAIVRPSTAYAAICWSHRINLQASSSNLRTAQRIAALMITRAFPSTDTDALDILSNLMPILDFILAEALINRSSLIANDRWISPTQSSFSHAAILNAASSVIPELSMPADPIKPLLMLDRPFSTSIEPRQESAAYSFSAPDHLYIFTDGSKLDNRTGAGMVCLLNGTFFDHASTSLGLSPSVFQTELFAISMACTSITASPSARHTSIHSDSQAALIAIAATILKSSSVLSCISDLISASQHCLSLTLCWVPGHSNIEGNDLADSLAREGSGALPIGPEPFLPIGRAALSSALKSHFYSKHCSKWNSSKASTKCKTPLTALLTVQHKWLHPLPPTSILRPYSQLLSGHSYLNYFQHRTGIIPSPLCPACKEEPETSEHLLCRCPAFSSLRQRLFGTSTIPIALLISTFSPSTIISYITKTGRSLERPPPPP